MISVFTPERAGPRAATASRGAQRGVGLIEILIAVVIISIGFLAGARMQVDSMRTSQSAYYRSQAYFMASTMVDSMRANVQGVRSGAYDGKSTDDAVSDPDCGANFCTPASIADQDLHNWRSELHALGRADFVPLLPSVAADGEDAAVNAEGTITRTAEGRYSVKLVWGEIVDGETVASELTLAFVAES